MKVGLGTAIRLLTLVVILLAVSGVAAVLVPVFQEVPQRHPSPEFRFEYTVEDENPDGPDWGTLTMTHACGEPVRQIVLFVSVAGLNESRSQFDEQYSDNNRTVHRTRWYGSTEKPDANSTADNDTRLVTKGDSMQLYVHSSAELLVRYEGPPGVDMVATLDNYVGPAGQMNNSWFEDTGNSDPMPVCDR